MSAEHFRAGTEILGAASPAAALWAHIYGEQPGYVGLFSGIRPEPGVQDLLDTQSAYFTWPDQAGRAERWLRDQSAAGREVYHCGHLLTARRRIKDNAAPMWALYVDGDGARIPPELPRPTAIVRSSPGREQFYWRLSRAVPAPEGERLNRRLAYAMGADRSGWDLTQLLRVPGTPNRKYPDAPIVELVSLGGGSHV
jgi:hypothetical protein